MSLHDPKCDRCKSVTFTTKVSWFNTQAICQDCQRIESEHPDYDYARKVEQDAVLAKNYNFPGVGWPGVNGRVNR